MRLVSWLQGHARSMLFLLAVLAASGLAAAFFVPVSLFPHVDFPRIQVNLEAGDQPAERMAIEITYPVEEALRSVPGVRRVRSTTSRGSADVSVNFDWGSDMVAALLQVQSQINKLLPGLPVGTSFNVRRMDPTVFPVIAYSLTSDTRSLTELRDLAQYELRPALTAVTGVARVEVQGGLVQEYQVLVDPARLQAFNMTLADIGEKLSASNVLTAVGHVDQYDKLYLVVSDTRLTDLQAIKDTILAAGPQGVVKVQDVAQVTDSTAPNFTRVTADGHDAVLLQIYQQPDANTVQIAGDIKAALDQLRPHLPGGLTIANWYNQSDLIIASAVSVRDSVLIGIGLAALVLLVFLRNFKITLIATLAVPAVLATTVLMLYVLGMSFNIMTLGGMAAAVGLIVDDAIVMVEHIIRRLRGGEGHERERVRRATAEFTLPLAGSSASTIIIFAPLAFLSGVTGAFFKALSLTMAAALVISFFVAWLAVPVLAARILGRKDAEQREGGFLSDRLQSAYERLMRGLLRHPWLVFFIIVPLLGIGMLSFSQLGSGFMPQMDEGGFILDYVAPPGTSLPETDRVLGQVESILQQTAEVDTYSRRTGLQLGGGLTETNTGDFFIRLKPPPRRHIEEVMDDVRQQVERHVPGLEIETLQLMEDVIGDLATVPQPIEIKLFSDDQATLDAIAPKVAAAIQTIRGVIEVKDGIVPAGDALVIDIDRTRASLEGADPDMISRSLSDMLDGNSATRIQHGPRLIGVRVRLPPQVRQSQQDLERLLIRAPDGHRFPLGRVATLHAVVGQPEISRDDLKRMVAVTGRISGRDLGSTIVDVKRVLDKGHLLPRGVTYQLGGLYKEQLAAFHGLLVVLIAAIVLVFFVLLLLYESVRIAMVLMATTVLSIAAVCIGLLITSTELNITAIMGITMIVGIVTELAIFYYSEYVELGQEHDGLTRLILAGRNRMRPIAMTSFAAALALLPLALGHGSTMQQPLAIAIISGLLAQLPIVLIVLPALLILFGPARRFAG